MKHDDLRWQQGNPGRSFYDWALRSRRYDSFCTTLQFLDGLWCVDFYEMGQVGWTPWEPFPKGTTLEEAKQTAFYMVTIGGRSFYNQRNQE